MKKKVYYILAALITLALVYALADDRLLAQSDTADSVDSSDSSGMTDSTKKSEPSAAQDSSSGGAKSVETAAVGDTVTTESGLSYVITKAGDGPRVKNGQEVSVHFVGRIAESGEEFYNSYKEKSPHGFSLGRGDVIKGCDEGITGMAVGEERTLFIPWALGYGERGHPGAKIPPKTDLIFDVELVSIEKGK